MGYRPDPPGPALRLVYSIPEVARMLSIGKSTVWRMIARHEFETVKINYRTLITHQSLMKVATPQDEIQNKTAPSPGIAKGGEKSKHYDSAVDSPSSDRLSNR